MKTIVAGINITNPNKIVFENDNIKKLKVIKYYEEISPLMLPFLNKRLISAIRCHDGANETCFYKKHPTAEKGFVEILNVNGEEYFYLKNKKQIVLEAQLGTIEFHTWGCKVLNINKPDIMVFDLDPDEKLPLITLRKGVLLLKEELDALKLKSFLKTSGGKGYHILLPLTAKNWDKFTEFSKNVARVLEAKHPRLFTTNIRKIDRKGKIFIDYLRNKKTATCVAPYSLRARDKAPISFPISWENLNRIKPNQITIKNYKKYISENPWQNFFKIKQIIK